MTLKKILLSALAGLLLLTATHASAQAEELTGTLKKIKEEDEKDDKDRLK